MGFPNQTYPLAIKAFAANNNKKQVENAVTNEMMAKAQIKFPLQTPSSKEEFYYRTIFDGYFTCPNAALTVPAGPTIARSTPTAFRWSKEFAKMADPSGRSIKVHKRPLNGRNVQ